MSFLATALAGVVLVAAPAGVASIGVSPDAIESAMAHSSYQLTVSDHSRVPETVRTVVTRAYGSAGSCQFDLNAPVSWASVSPSTFHLAAGASRVVTVSIETPPAGKSELIAGFIGQSVKHGGVSTSSGVGAVLRLSEPGTASAAPCPRPTPRPSGSPAVAAGASHAGISLGETGLVAASALGLGALGMAIVSRRRRNNRKASK